LCISGDRKAAPTWSLEYLSILTAESTIDCNKNSRELMRVEAIIL
jgi:hypothetical protein